LGLTAHPGEQTTTHRSNTGTQATFQQQKWPHSNFPARTHTSRIHRLFLVEDDKENKTIQDIARNLGKKQCRIGTCLRQALNTNLPAPSHWKLTWRGRNSYPTPRNHQLTASKGQRSPNSGELTKSQEITRLRPHHQQNPRRAAYYSNQITQLFNAVLLKGFIPAKCPDYPHPEAKETT
jgi:hypothetical protein